MTVFQRYLGQTCELRSSFPILSISFLRLASIGVETSSSARYDLFEAFQVLFLNDYVYFYRDVVRTRQCCRRAHALVYQPPVELIQLLSFGFQKEILRFLHFDADLQG